MIAESMEQRKDEGEDYTEPMAMDSAAKETIHFAKNHLNKFYNPCHGGRALCAGKRSTLPLCGGRD